MIPINFIISSLGTVNCKLFLSRLAYLLVCSTSNSTMSLKKLSNISHFVLSDNSGYMFKSFPETFSLVTSSITTGFFRWLFLLLLFFFSIFGFYVLLFLFSWGLITIATFFVVFTLIIITIWFNWSRNYFYLSWNFPR